MRVAFVTMIYTIVGTVCASETTHIMVCVAYEIELRVLSAVVFLIAVLRAPCRYRCHGAIVLV